MRRASHAAATCDNAFKRRAAKNNSARAASEVPYWLKNQYAMSAEFKKPPPMLSSPKSSASRVMTRLLRGSTGRANAGADPAPISMRLLSAR